MPGPAPQASQRGSAKFQSVSHGHGTRRLGASTRFNILSTALFSIFGGVWSVGGLGLTAPDSVHFRSRRGDHPRLSPDQQARGCCKSLTDAGPSPRHGSQVREPGHDLTSESIVVVGRCADQNGV